MFDRPAIKARAKEILNLNLGHLIAAFALAVMLPSALTGGSNGGISSFNMNNPASPSFSQGSPFLERFWPLLVIVFIGLACILFLVVLALTAVRLIGQGAFSRMSLMAYDGVEVRVGDLLGIKDYWLKLLGLYLWMGLRIIAWSLLFIIPGIIALYRYALAPYLMFEDPSKGINQVIDESSALMNGFKGELFIFDLSFIGWWLLVAVTFGLAIFWVGPYYEIARAGAYRAIRYLAGARQASITPATAPNPSIVTGEVAERDSEIFESVAQEATEDADSVAEQATEVAESVIESIDEEL